MRNAVIWSRGLDRTCCFFRKGLHHIDGICNFLSPGVVALSNFSDVAQYSNFSARLVAAFGPALTIVPFPYAPTADVWADGFESAVGIYVNFARASNALFLPVFGTPLDQLALDVAAAHSDKPVVAVNASSVAIMGGSVRCLSSYLWGSPAAVLGAQTVAPPAVTSTTGAASISDGALAGADTTFCPASPPTVGMAIS